LTFKVPSRATKKLLEEACQIYEEDLKGSIAEKYLSNRGLTKEVQTYFRLGYVKPEGSHFPGHEFMGDRLVIPYITNSGIVQMRFRAIPENGEVAGPCASPKYKSETGASVTMFNVRDFSTQGIIAVTEGEIDAITAHMAGIPAIGIPGAENWEKKADVFARAFYFRKVVILADNDDKGAGKEFAKDVQKSIKGSRIIMMPNGYDVNKFVMEFGTNALREKVGLDAA